MFTSPDIGSDQTYCLRWKGSNAIDLPTIFCNMRENEEFFDVSLSCSINQNGSSALRAHRAILAAYSPVFKDMLMRLSDRSDPSIHLKGVSQENLHHMLDFMYNGSINISKSNIDSFLSDAEDLQIKGLILENDSVHSDADTGLILPPQQEAKRPKGRSSLDNAKKSRKTLNADSSSLEPLWDADVASEQGKTLELSAKEEYVDPNDGTYNPSISGGNDGPLPKGTVGYINDFIKDEGNCYYSGKMKQKRKLARCRICTKECRRDQIEAHINTVHTSYLITPTKDVENLRRARRQRKSSSKKTTNIKQETGGSAIKQEFVFPERTPSQLEMESSLETGSDDIKNDINSLVNNIVGDLNPEKSSKLKKKTYYIKKNKTHTEIEDIFEVIKQPKILGVKKRSLLRCKLCLKDVRKDKRKGHLRTHRSDVQHVDV